MKKTIFIFFVLLLGVCLTTLSDAVALVGVPDAIFSRDYANFESFYKEGGTWGWIIGTILALLGVVTLVFTGGTASPLVAGIGSAVGGMMGLSGAAATSAGLAFLGGGSLAAGGFGMAGGAVLIGAVLEGTVLVGSQYVDAIGRESSYQELCQQMKDYPNFPPIKNDSGPAEIGKVFKILKEDYDTGLPNSAARNQRAVRDAIYQLKKYKPEEDRVYKINYKEVIRHEQLRVNSLLALLYFMENDYKSAYFNAKRALIYFNRNDGGPASVPNFIIAAAGLVTKETSPNDSMRLFSQVIGSESKSPILPLLYSIYISRAGAAEVINKDFLEALINSTSRIENKEIRPVVDSQIMMAILARLWTNQQAIMTIGNNISSFNLQKAKEMCRDNLKDYVAILGLAKSFHSVFPSETADEQDFLRDTSASIRKYSEDLPGLQDMLRKVYKFSEIEQQKSVQVSTSQESQDEKNLQNSASVKTPSAEGSSMLKGMLVGAFLVIIGFILIMFIVFLIKIRRKNARKQNTLIEIDANSSPSGEEIK